VSAEALPGDARARGVTVSDRSHGGLRHDTSGPLLSDLLRELGFAEADVVLVPDEVAEVTSALRAAVDDGVDLIATTGGTGFAPRDVTPEATRALLDREAPGLAEALRMFNRETVPTTILSRAVAGIIGSTIVVNLPGSTSGVRDGVAVLAPVIGHAVVQLRGGDH
jgi:molybdenum cofactor synthesis domain-containing protein